MEKNIVEKETRPDFAGRSALMPISNVGQAHAAGFQITFLPAAVLEPFTAYKEVGPCASC